MLIWFFYNRDEEISAAPLSHNMNAHNIYEARTASTFLFSPARLTVSICVCVRVCTCVCVRVDLCSAVGGVRSVGVSTLKVRRSLGLEPAAQLLIVRNTKTHTSDITDHMMQEVWKSAVNLLLCS